jgi:hypothetical protein
MSTALAIAATSRVIAAIIDDAVAAARLTLPSILGSATTTASPPDHLDTIKDQELTNLNLFLYHVTYNQGWREVGLPTRDSNGASIGRAPLGLDLHYLLSAYSSGDYEAQIMLGIGMQALHEIPELFRQKITDVFSAPVSEVDKALATSGLVDQVELMKISPQQLTTDELAKLWTAMPGKFRVSAGYAVTVAIIETKAPSLAPLPVLTPVVTVIPFSEPSIDAIVPQLVPYAVGASLIIYGGNLAGQNTVVIFDGASASPQTPTPIGNGASVSVPLPVLAAGINTLRVARQVDLGELPLTTAAESNTASFLLQPVIARSPVSPFPYEITVGAPDPSTTPPTVPVTVKVAPALTTLQTVSLLLAERNVAPGATPLSYQFDAAPEDISPPDTIVFKTQGVTSGKTYLVRVRVDGANSPLDVDSTTKQFVTPAVTF